MTIDIHCHPSLKTYLFDRRFEDDNHSGAGGNPIEYMILDMLTDYPKLTRGGIKAIMSAIYVPEKTLLDDCKPIRLALPFSERFRDVVRNDPFDMTISMLDQFEAKVERARSRGCAVRVVRTFAELRSALTSGQLAIAHTVEGAHSLGVNPDQQVCLSHLQRLFDRGVCMLTLAHFYDNVAVSPVVGMPPTIKTLLCGTKGKDLTKGLTSVGESVVLRMHELGMLVDLTHCTPVARKRVFEISEGKHPLLFSHVGTCANPKNPTREELRAIGDCGGAVGVIFNTYWLRGRETTFFERDFALPLIADTIAHIAKTAGIESVAIGTDLDGFTDPPDDVRDSSQMPVVRNYLEKRGFSAADLDRIFTDNAIRVLKEGWRREDSSAAIESPINIVASRDRADMEADRLLFRRGSRVLLRDSDRINVRLRAIVGPPAAKLEGEARLAMEALDRGSVPTPAQRAALESVIRMMRPAPRSIEGRIEDMDEEMRDAFPHWDTFRTSVAQHLYAIGRLDQVAAEGTRAYGTGFLVADDVLVTNWHVLDFLSSSTQTLETGQAIVHFRREYDTSDVDSVSVTGVVKYDRELDLAAFRIEAPASSAARQPLKLADFMRSDGDPVVAVGYPLDDRIRNPLFVSQLYEGVFGVKRAAPGELIGSKPSVLFHDCSTLAGNSGSPLFCMQTARVIGVHRSGHFLYKNEAVERPALQTFLQGIV